MEDDQEIEIPVESITKRVVLFNQSQSDKFIEGYKVIEISLPRVRWLEREPPECMRGT